MTRLFDHWFVAEVTGRRRIGKATLIQQAISRFGARVLSTLVFGVAELVRVLIS